MSPHAYMPLLQLFCLTCVLQDNNDVLTAGHLRHAEEVLRWSREVLASQRPILLKGSFAGSCLPFNQAISRLTSQTSVLYQ